MDAVLANYAVLVLGLSVLATVLVGLFLDALFGGWLER